jgi:hypothetical protein
MKSKKGRLFLYIAIACFAGIVAIFVVDGYLGIYDTFHISVGEYPAQTITADYWLREDYDYEVPYPVGTERDRSAYCCISADWDQDITFEYVIENHAASAYSDHIEVSLWQKGEKIKDLFSQDISARPFDETSVEWTVSTDDIGVNEPTAEYSYVYTVLVKRGEVERNIIVEFYYRQVSEFPDRLPAVRIN